MSTLHEPLVSFVVTSYNHAPYIAECLESILRQTATQDLEIVVVDDGSQDDTDRIVRGFHDPRVHYIRQPQNRGSIATLNAAFVQARGQFIARQCYSKSFLSQLPGPPQHGSGHRWVGTFLGQARYETVKTWVKRVGAS